MPESRTLAFRIPATVESALNEYMKTTGQRQSQTIIQALVAGLEVLRGQARERQHLEQAREQEIQRLVSVCHLRRRRRCAPSARRRFIAS